MVDLDEIFKEIDKECSALADNMLKESPIPPNPLMSQDLAREQAHRELTDYLAGKEIRNRIIKGFQIIFRELSIHETPKLIQSIQDEWKKCQETFTGHLQPATDKLDYSEEIPPSFQETFLVSDETIEHFYQCGLRLYNQKCYGEASDVFFVVSSLDHRRHNTWMALGLAEKGLKNWELALSAFCMGSATNIKDPLSFIYSAECYTALGQKHDAENCVQFALEILEENPTLKTQELTNYISFLKKSLSQTTI